MHFFKEEDISIIITAVGSRAAELFRSGSYRCSGAVLCAVNEAAADPMPSDIAKLAAGFSGGIGQGCMCGALSGGILALGLALGQSFPGADNRSVTAASKELHTWFVKANGSSCCRVLIKGKGFGKKAHCTSLTKETAAKTAEIICRSFSAEMNIFTMHTRD